MLIKLKYYKKENLTLLKNLYVQESKNYEKLEFSF